MNDTTQHDARVTVILFKPRGKYYTEERWRIPEIVQDWSERRGTFERPAMGPYDMLQSPDFRRIDGGAVLVESQEPWGFPHLFPGVSACEPHERQKVILGPPQD